MAEGVIFYYGWTMFRLSHQCVSKIISCNPWYKSRWFSSSSYATVVYYLLFFGAQHAPTYLLQYSSSVDSAEIGKHSTRIYPLMSFIFWLFKYFSCFLEKCISSRLFSVQSANKVLLLCNFTKWAKYPKLPEPFIGTWICFQKTMNTTTLFLLRG